jgi:hypothetical protein
MLLWTTDQLLLARDPKLLLWTRVLDATVDNGPTSSGKRPLAAAVWARDLLLLLWTRDLAGVVLCERVARCENVIV